jgi:DNA-binding MarR family transcriptional regulator
MLPYLINSIHGDRTMQSPLQPCLIHLLHEASRTTAELFDRHRAALNLTARQYVILTAIAQNPGASQAEIARITGVDRANIASTTLRLVRSGHVSRARSSSDARSCALRLTRKGLAVLILGDAIATRVDSQLLASLSLSIRNRFTCSLRTIAAANDQQDITPGRQRYLAAGNGGNASVAQ